MNKKMEDRRNNDIQMAELKKDVEYIKGALDDNKLEHKEILTLVKNLIDDMPNNYAGKWVEKIMWGGLTTIGTIIVTALMYLIIIKPF